MDNITKRYARLIRKRQRSLAIFAKITAKLESVMAKIQSEIADARREIEAHEDDIPIPPGNTEAGRLVSLAKTDLESSCMWAVKALSRTVAQTGPRPDHRDNEAST